MNLLQMLRSRFVNVRVQKAFRIIVIGLVFLFAFSVPSFGSRTKYNIIMYAFMILLTSTNIVYYFLFKPKLNLKQWQLYIIPSFAIFAFLGTAIYSHSFRSWISLVFLAASFFSLLFSFKVLNNRSLIAFILSTAIFAFACYFIIHYRKDILNFANFENEGFRLGRYFDNQNAIAAECVVGLSASLYLALFYKNKKRYFAYIPFLIITLVGVSTGSRTFILALVVVLLTMLFFKFKNHKLLYLLVVVLLAVFGIILLNFPFMDTLRQRFIRFFQTLFSDSSRVDTSSIERMTWFDYAFVLGFKNVIIGYGAEGFSTYSGVGTYAHSNLAEVFCDFGIIGLFLFYSPLFIFLFSSIKNKKKGIAYIIPLVIYYIFVSFSNVFYYNKFYYFNLAFMYFLTYDDVDKKVTIVDLKEKVNHIVFTCQGLESGGAEKVISTLSNSFAERGYKVTVVGAGSLNSTPYYKLDPRVEYIDIHNGKQKLYGSFNRVRHLHKTLKQLKPDIVISFLPHIIVYTYLSMFGIKAPLIVSERNDPHLDPKEKMLRILKKYSFSKADGCVFQTNDAKKYFSKSIQKKSVVIHNPVMTIYDGNLSICRNKTIISVGRLVKQKNFPCLINAFELFKNSHPEYRLKIYGEGPLKEELHNLILRKNLDSSIFLMGSSSDWHNLEKDSPLFVTSSDYEGMPNALAEAMALGIPCVGTNCPIGGTKELIKEGINGYLCEVDNPLDMYNKMEKAIRLSINQKLVSDFKNEHNPQHISELWLVYMKNVLERKLSE